MIASAGAYAEDLFTLTNPAADPADQAAAVQRMAEAIVSTPSWKEDLQAGRLRAHARVLAAVKHKLNDLTEEQS